MNLRKQTTARKLPEGAGKNRLELVPRVRANSGPEVNCESPLKVRSAVMPYLCTVPEYATLSDEVVIEMARQRVCRRLHITDRWVAIALLLDAINQRAGIRPIVDT